MSKSEYKLLNLFVKKKKKIISIKINFCKCSENLI